MTWVTPCVGRRGRHRHHSGAQRDARLRPLRRGRPRQRRVVALRPHVEHQRRPGPDDRPGCADRPGGGHRQRHRPAPALRGARQRQGRGPVVPRGTVRLRHQPDLAELPRRAAGGQLLRRRRRAARGLRPRQRQLPDQHGQRSGRRAVRPRHRHPGRRRLGRRRRHERGRPSRLRPHLLPQPARRRHHPGDGQPQRHPGRRRLERRPPLGRRCAQGHQQRHSGCASPTASPSPCAWARPATSR